MRRLFPNLVATMSIHCEHHPALAAAALALCAGATLGSPALAQPAPSALAECAAIAPDSERLACFDRLSGR